MTRLKNTEFADKTGYDFTTASRLRQGARLPSIALMAQMWRAFKLDGNAVFSAYLQGREAFTSYLNATVFDPPAEVEGRSGRCPTCLRPLDDPGPGTE